MFRFVGAFFATALLSSIAVAADVEHPASLDASQGQYAVVAPVFTGADNNTSFIRLFYTSSDAAAASSATFTVKVVGSPSGTVYGTASIAVPLYAAPQYSLAQILSLASVSGLAAGDSAYALYIDGGVDGTGFAHVIYNGANGFFENASACQAYVQAPMSGKKTLYNVHTSRLSTYPSQIYVHNYSTSALGYQATVRDAKTGAKIGTLNLQAGANTTVSIPFASLEQQLGWTPDSTQLHANVTFDVDGADTVPLVVTAFITNQALNTSVNMSAFCQAHGLAGTSSTASSFSLTVSKIGVGTGTVTSSPQGINCGTTCSATFSRGTVTLTAVPAAGSTFVGWSGCASTSGTNGGVCNVDLSANKTATATFGANVLTVTKIGTGTGTVTSSTPAIDCGNTCTATFSDGQIVSLTATPAAGSTFQSWSGCTSTSGTAGNVCSVTMSASKTVTATFGANALTVTKIGTGTGTVASSSPAIDCGNTCSATFGDGQIVSLTATPAAGSSFQSWSGCTSTSGNICSVTMNASKTVTVTFSAPPTLTVQKLGSGTVTSSQGGISCGSTCSAQFTDGEIVTLTATPASGLNVDFLGWSGCTSTSGVICSVTMSTGRTVTATFK